MRYLRRLTLPVEKVGQAKEAVVQPEGRAHQSYNPSFRDQKGERSAVVIVVTKIRMERRGLMVNRD